MNFDMAESYVDELMSHLDYADVFEEPSGMNSFSDSLEVKPIITPALDFFTPKPTAKVVQSETEAQLLSPTTSLKDVTNLSDQEMVALRLAFSDLSHMGYTMADYEDVRLWVEREQADKLNELLKLHRPGKAKTTRLLAQKSTTEKNPAMLKWLKREPQRRLAFWDAEDIVEQLEGFDFRKDLTIFDLSTIVDRLEFSQLMGLPLYLGVPPSHIESQHRMQGPGAPTIFTKEQRNDAFEAYRDDPAGPNLGATIPVLPDRSDSAQSNGGPHRRKVTVGGENLTLLKAAVPQILEKAMAKRKLVENNGDEIRETQKQKVSHDDHPFASIEDGAVTLDEHHIGEEDMYAQRPSPKASDETTILRAVPESIPAEMRFKMPVGFFGFDNFDLGDPRAYAKYLSDMVYPQQITPDEMRYVPLPPMHDAGALSRHLNSFSLISVEPPLPLFRDFEGISSTSRSVLARCVRFAKSDAQLLVDWRLHPMHVYAIMLRTNPYGMELLVGRTELDSLAFGHLSLMVQFETLVAIRAAHARYAQGDVRMYIAADIPDLMERLRDDNEQAATTLHLGHARRYGIFVRRLIQETQERMGNIHNVIPGAMQAYDEFPEGF
ncbi:hypothetical protein J1614_006687 [Plenodomus biglobosus]|nr:hypothetical protein J1614_006687 [Plenodomus biglobosus]